mmetsp:Transcript_20945/g.59208  ORF Transcript_20945/g.59208 Transcript_20945/m.59208 type:complete len:238 (+) Transcript_20945:693-1406(+)
MSKRACWKSPDLEGSAAAIKGSHGSIAEAPSALDAFAISCASSSSAATAATGSLGAADDASLSMVPTSADGPASAVAGAPGVAASCEASASALSSASTSAANGVLSSAAACASPLPFFLGRRRLRVASSALAPSAGVPGTGAAAAGVGAGASADAGAAEGTGASAGASFPCDCGCSFRGLVWPEAVPDVPLEVCDALEGGTRLRALLTMPASLSEAPDAASVTRAAAPLAFSLKSFR